MVGSLKRRIDDEILDLTRERGVVRPRDLARVGLARAPLTRLVRRGDLVRTGRGLYALPDAEISEHHSLAEAAVRVPNGVVCLLSALRFHELGTQNPHQVWLAIHPKARLPRVEQPPIHIVRFSGPALTLGIEEHGIDGVQVRVFSAAKTVVDCFRYRNKLGLDVALEALRDYLDRGGAPDDLWKIAQECRMARVMQPYIEASL
jgi:predicted transcriptional regulator of viral defense system